MRRMVPFVCVIAAGALWAGPTVWGRVLYVDDDAAAPGDGASWTTAYRYLQDALTAAATADDPIEIRVAQGIYRPDQSATDPQGTGDRLASFSLVDGVVLTGGYAGWGTNDPNAWDVNTYLSVLSGDLAGNDVLAEDPCDYVEDREDGIWSRPESWCLLIESTRRENSVHIVTAVDAVGAAVLEGFSLTGGNAYWPPHWWTWDAPTTCKNEDYGGALFHQGMTVMLRACTFFGNSSICLGGAVCSLDSSWLVMEDCRFAENYSYEAGGGVYSEAAANVVMTGCVLEENDAQDGSGLYARNCDLLISDCRFEKNVAALGGGALLERCVATLDRCEFNDNKWTALDDNGSDLRLAHCIFRGNSGGDGGGCVSPEEAQSW